VGFVVLYLPPLLQGVYTLPWILEGCEVCTQDWYVGKSE